MSNLNEFIEQQECCYVFVDTYSSYLVFERAEEGAHVWTWANTEKGWAEARKKVGHAASTGGGAHITWYEAGHLTALLRIAEARSYET